MGTENLIFTVPVLPIPFPCQFLFTGNTDIILWTVCLDSSVVPACKDRFILGGRLELAYLMLPSILEARFSLNSKEGGELLQMKGCDFRDTVIRQ